jgi:hypothetical protein
MMEPGLVVHTCNLSYTEGRVGRIEVQKAILGKMLEKLHVNKKDRCGDVGLSFQLPRNRK